MGSPLVFRFAYVFSAGLFLNEANQCITALLSPPTGRCPASPGSFVLFPLRGTLHVQYVFTISLIDTVAACEEVIAGHEFPCGRDINYVKTLVAVLDQCCIINLRSNLTPVVFVDEGVCLNINHCRTLLLEREQLCLP